MDTLVAAGVSLSQVRVTFSQWEDWLVRQDEYTEIVSQTVPDAHSASGAVNRTHALHYADRVLGCHIGVPEGIITTDAQSCRVIRGGEFYRGMEE